MYCSTPSILLRLTMVGAKVIRRMSLVCDWGMAAITHRTCPESESRFQRCRIFLISRILGRRPRLRDEAAPSAHKHKLLSSTRWRAVANQNALIKVLPFQGVYALVTSVSHHSTGLARKRVRGSPSGGGAGVCDCRCANGLHFGRTRAQEKTSSG